MPRFKPGQSGNPRGRPKGRSTRERVREILSEGDGEALATWVRGLLADPKSAPVVLDLLKFVDGATPDGDPTERAAAEAERPRINIPSVDERYARLDGA